MPNVGPIPIEQILEPYPLNSRPSLAHSYSEVAACWCWKKNCGYGPEDFSAGSKAEVWWICPDNKNHVYQQGIKSRVTSHKRGKAGCPYCDGKLVCDATSFVKHYPDVAKEWHPELNTLDINALTVSSGVEAWWLCGECGKEWKTRVVQRTTKGNGCPRCNRGETVDLRKYPIALAMVDAALNNDLDVTHVLQNRPIWWRCKEGDDHLWIAQFYKHKEKPICPFCAGRQPSSTNNLSLLPELAKEFHKTKNGNLRPKDLTTNTNN